MQPEKCPDCDHELYQIEVQGLKESVLLCPNCKRAWTDIALGLYRASLALIAIRHKAQAWKQHCGDLREELEVIAQLADKALKWEK